ncbi:MAG: S8 family serine peptidase [Planctomycetes bacterium]|nr:S8 family serine peptidase [Planctomycetota bacterium]
MRPNHDDKRGPVGGIWQVAAVSALIAAAAPIPVSGQHHIKRPGKQIPLTVSTTEYGVRLNDLGDGGACAQRLAASVGGVVENVPGTRDWQLKLLRVPVASTEVRERIAREPCVEDVQRVYRLEGSDVPLIATGTISVRLRAGLGAGGRAAVFADHAVEIVPDQSDLRDVYLVIPTVPGTDEVLLAAAMADDDRTVWAEPNLVRPGHTRQVSADDEFFDEQWHLDNSGQNGGLSGADINILDAWAIAQGSDVTFGIFDDAVDVDHEDLRDGYTQVGHDITVATQQSGVNNPRPKTAGDRHGTAVLGLALASANPLGVRGVSFLSRFTATRGATTASSDNQKAQAYTFARQDGVDVHINSWALPAGGVPSVIRDALDTAFQQGRDSDGSGGAAPRGMVVVFAAGNGGTKFEDGDDLSMLPSVIGVGATNNRDERALSSNYGNNITLLAPGVGVATTDVTDAAFPSVETGYNSVAAGGFTQADGTIVNDLDDDGKYTAFFDEDGGTSAACAIVAGVAGLILSVNPDLTVTDVRMILEHTAAQIEPEVANYDRITSKSETHGYGRVDALAAVEAAVQTVGNGGLTWPEIPHLFRYDEETGELVWDQFDTRRKFFGQGNLFEEFFLVESATAFDFIPADAACYHCETQDSTDDDEEFAQSGCLIGTSCAPLTLLPAGIVSRFQPCQVTSVDGICGENKEHRVQLEPSQADRWFAIYARNAIGRYSFGEWRKVEGDPDAGQDPDDPDDPDVVCTDPPEVVTTVTPTDGASPLSVSFRGNAPNGEAIDESLTLWEFDRNDSDGPTSDERTTNHTYVVPFGETRQFHARLTLVDIDGCEGFDDVIITVDGGGTEGGGTVGQSQVSIVVGVPGTLSSDQDTGASPFKVELQIDAAEIVGELQSVEWDLGDGTTSNGLSVLHTYINDTDTVRTFPVTATVTTITSTGTPVISQPSRIITVLPAPASGPGGSSCLPGAFCETDGKTTGTTACGVGMLTVLACCTFSFLGVRRFRRK